MEVLPRSTELLMIILLRLSELLDKLSSALIAACWEAGEPSHMLLENESARPSPLIQ